MSPKTFPKTISGELRLRRVEFEAALTGLQNSGSACVSARARDALRSDHDATEVELSEAHAEGARVRLACAQHEDKLRDLLQRCHAEMVALHRYQHYACLLPGCESLNLIRTIESALMEDPAPEPG